MTFPVDREIKLPDVIVLTGLSGAGMSSALNALEDLGFFCVDNLPVTLLPTFSRLLIDNDENKAAIERAALVINIREGEFLEDLPARLTELSTHGLEVFMIFLEATDEVLRRRFSETRRPHPADKKGIGLHEAIEKERREMEKIRSLADSIIDTSNSSVHDLRREVMEKFSVESTGVPLRLQIISFGHKYGSLRDADLLFDVRHLPNPYFIADLRDLPGTDRRVVSFLNEQAEVGETIRRFEDLLKYLLPLYKREGKSYLSIGIGCTGGKHRSVMVANEIAKRLKKSGYDATSVHRDVKKALKSKRAARKKQSD